MKKKMSRYFIMMGIFSSLSLFSVNKNSELNIAKKYNKIDSFRKFVVFVPSYNNEAFCKKNLESIFNQTYKNYRVVYFDDKSTDSTYQKVCEIVANSGMVGRTTIVRNLKNQKNLKNLYDCVHDHCLDDEIVVNLDGDDFFAHVNVLKNLNAYYQPDDVWMTWGNYKHWSTDRLGEHAAPIKKTTLKLGTVRSRPYCYSHLKTFYAALFKKVKKEHLMYKGKFIQLAPDLPTMLPLIEMSSTHAYFIPEVLYIYNDRNPISEGHVTIRQDYFDVRDYVFQLPSYPALKKRDW